VHSEARQRLQSSAFPDRAAEPGNEKHEKSSYFESEGFALCFE